MAEVKWIKIVTDIFDDEKILLIETLPECDSIIVIWFKLLCLAGKQNNSGVFTLNGTIPYTDKMLAIIFRRKETTVKLALETFKNFGMIEIINDTITIPNWSKHQNFSKIEKNNEYMREYMREYRTKQKLLASCKVNSKVNSKTNVSALDKNRIEKNNICSSDDERNNSLLDDFNKIWEIYPRKDGKNTAFKHYKSWLKGKKYADKTIKLTNEQILNAVNNYKKQVSNTEKQYIKMGSTFFNESIIDYLDKETKEKPKQEYKDIDISRLTQEEYSMLVKKQVTVQELIEKGRIDVR